jgi:hypothetical protein
MGCDYALMVFADYGIISPISNHRFIGDNGGTLINANNG